jgi:hypothetical protein
VSFAAATSPPDVADDNLLVRPIELYSNLQIPTSDPVLTSAYRLCKHVCECQNPDTSG